MILENVCNALRHGIIYNGYLIYDEDCNFNNKNVDI